MLRTVLVIVAVLLVLGVVATLAISGESGNGKADRGPDLTMEELGTKLAATMQSDLRDAQRERGLDGAHHRRARGLQERGLPALHLPRPSGRDARGPRAPASEPHDYRPPWRGRRLGRERDLAHAVLMRQAPQRVR